MNINLPVPPPELSQWIGLVGGLLGIVSFIGFVIAAWRSRRRIDFHVIASVIYWDTWDQFDYDEASQISWPGRPNTPPSFKPGDCRRSFRVIEFQLISQYPHDITLGRFVVDGWIYSDHNVIGSRNWQRDYRVFDLHTGSPTTLEKYIRVQPHASCGLRLEIYETASGPMPDGGHPRYTVSIPKKSRVGFSTDVGRHQKKLIKYQQASTDTGHLKDCYHLSDLLPKSEATANGLPIPQGVEEVDTTWDLPRRFKVRYWLTNRSHHIRHGFGRHWNRLVLRYRRVIQRDKASDSERG